MVKQKMLDFVHCIQRVLKMKSVKFKIMQNDVSQLQFELNKFHTVDFSFDKSDKFIKSDNDKNSFKNSLYFIFVQVISYCT